MARRPPGRCTGLHRTGSHQGAHGLPEHATDLPAPPPWLHVRAHLARRTCSATPSTAPRCCTCPSGHPEVNEAWTWGALLAASVTAWLHQLTASPHPDGALLGHGIRDGQAMIATLRHRLIRIPARLVRHAGGLTLRLPPGYHLLDEILTRIRALPATADSASSA